jgi:mono/diheme cytochrome c family protein
MKRTLVLHRMAPAVVAAGALALALAAGGARAADEKPAYSASAGAVTYRTYCANCHGSDGRGEGYIAPTLRVKPSDLTQLATKNGGVYPEERVRAAIDGRTDVRAHGSREMPIWGDVFLWPEEDSAERRAHVERKIGELVEHLREMQQPAAAR